MRLGSILGQERVIDALTRSISSGRVAHAYLFDGISGCGRRTTAIALLQALFCKTPVNGDSCGSCNSCRKIEAGNHPDLQFLAPLPDKRDISIDQVRELQQMLSLRPYEAGRKGCIIEPAERMSIGASNALLKTLEEPPGNAVMILLTNQSDILLSTIRSRCQHLRFSPLNEVSVATILKGQGIADNEAAMLAPLSEGSLENAFLSDVDAAESRRTELLEILSSVNRKNVATVFDPSEKLASSRDETLSMFTLLLSILRDLMIMRTSPSGSVIYNRFIAEPLSREAARFTPSSIIEALQLALDVRRAVQGNVNSKLAVEHFLFGYSSLRDGTL